MSKLEFDSLGNLFPYERVRISFEEFEELFVSPFGQDSSRHRIYGNYCRFLDDFKDQVTPDFIQWIDGSFISKK